MFARLRFRRHRERLYTWLIALGGTLLAVGAAVVAGDYAHKAADEGFRREVAPRAAAIEATVARNVQMVRSLAAFMSGSEVVGNDDFRAFVDVMRAEAAGILALQWMPRVAAADRAAFEAEAQLDFPGYRIEAAPAVPGADADTFPDVYFPVHFAEPLMGNEWLLGRDAAADKEITDALQRALRQHDVAATGRLALAANSSVDQGVMLVSPVFDGEGALRGYVGALLRMDVVMEMAIAGLPVVGLQIRVTDVSEGGAARVLHVFNDRQATTVPPLQVVDSSPSADGLAEGPEAIHDIVVADRVWRVALSPGHGYSPAPPLVSPALAALAVMLVTAIITLQFLLMQRRARILARASFTDGLTGLANRAFCDRMLDAEWERAVRHGKWLSVLFVDIDRFADYNAHVGPLAADECLRRIAGVLSSISTRASDIPCRYTGDRFALVLPETDHEGARHLGEQVRLAASGLQTPYPGRGPVAPLTVSVAVVSVRPRRGDVLAALLDAALDLLDSPQRGNGNVILDLSVGTR